MDHDEDEDDPRGEPLPSRPRGSCGKMLYRGEQSARGAVRRLQRHGRGQAFSGRLRPYFCPECHAWHVGHSGYDD